MSTFSYEFKIGEGVDSINFDQNEDEIKKILGKPDDIEHEEMDFGDDVLVKSTDYFYDDLGLIVSFDYENGEFIENEIFMNKCILDGKDLYTLDKEQIFAMLSNHSEIPPQEAFEEITDFDVDLLDEEKLADQYIFDDIGLALWFEDDTLIDVCISKPF